MYKNEYRAWDKKREWMLYSGDSCGYVAEQEKHDLDVINSLLQKADNKNLIYLQFVGLLDVEHNKIYEADIVEKNGVIGVVEFFQGLVSFVIREQSGQLAYFETDNTTHTAYKKLGNIYENKELWSST